MPPLHCTVPRRSATYVQARDRGGIEAHAGAGRAALPVQHAGVGPVPDRNGSSRGRQAALASHRLSAGGLPQLRASSTTLGKEVGLAAAYLNILKMRMGPRLVFDIDVPAELEQHPFPPNLLISLVENAIKHGVEPAADGGTIPRQRGRDGDCAGRQRHRHWPWQRGGGSRHAGQWRRTRQRARAAGGIVWKPGHGLPFPTSRRTARAPRCRSHSYCQAEVADLHAMPPR